MKTTNYPEDFVKRTKKLIESHYEHIKTNGELEVTFLINCLLGLIVAVAENGKETGLISNSEILNSIQKIGFSEKASDTSKQELINHDEITITIKHKDCLAEKEYQWFLKKLRNAIAHQNIEPINEKEKWTGVKMWNESRDGIKDFAIELTNDELKRLALSIAGNYLGKIK
jgi:hypothetical protein